MSVDGKQIVKQIDEAIKEYKKARAQAQHDDLSDLGDAGVAKVAGILASTLDRLAPGGSNHRANLDRLFQQYGNNWQSVDKYLGALEALKLDYERGYLETVESLVHADTFSGFLEMAEHLQQNGYKDPAAVIAGSVLEQHLRELAGRGGISVMQGDKFKKAETLNSELASKGLYTKLDQKNVTSWLGLRNDAAHGNYSEYSKEQVRLLIDSIADFIGRHPA